MPRNPSVSKKAGITPLWIVAAFLSLTEVTLGFAVTQVMGWIQASLAIFVMIFPLLVAAAFFGILWNRPWVFYAPSEYGNVDPKHFMSAMRAAPLVTEQLELAKSVEANPDDADARFALIDAMADEGECQWVIFMHETGKDVPGYSRHVYEFKDHRAGSGSFNAGGRNKLAGAGVTRSSGGGSFVSLTSEGRAFAEWLLKRGRRCDFFWSELGGWGSPIPGGVAEKWVAEQSDEAG